MADNEDLCDDCQITSCLIQISNITGTLMTTQSPVPVTYDSGIRFFLPRYTDDFT